MKEIYVDNNATTRVDDAVFAEMRPYFCELYGNPSSMHFFGGQVQKKVDEARNRVAALLGASPDEIIFTACGTESDNAAIRSAIEVFPEKRHIITSRVEHPAVLTLCRNLAKRGYRVTELNVDGAGRLDLQELKAAVDEDTAIVSLMYANNETGVVFPIEEIGAIVKEKGALFHTDAVQAVGKIPLDMATSSIDMLSLSGHKLHAPKGIGALYLRKGAGQGAARPAGKGADRPHSPCQDQRRWCRAAPQYPVARLRVRRRGGDPAAFERKGDLCLVGECLHVGVAGAFPRAAGHGGAVHLRPRLDPFLPVALQYR